MNRLILLGIATTLGAAKLAFFPANPPVDLQPTSPGTAQTGHLNITGTATVGLLKSQGTVFGASTATTGFAYGGFFTAASNQGRGFYGFASSTSGLTYGGFFQNASTSGRAVFGLATATAGNNYGGYFQTASTTGRGVLGVAASSTGTTYGVYGKSVSPAGFGVYSDGNMAATGVISGNGSGLTSVNAATLGGNPAGAFMPQVPVLILANHPQSLFSLKNSSAVNGAVSIAGWATGDTSANTGGDFRSFGVGGTGVFGLAGSDTGDSKGVWGVCNSSTGTAIYGQTSAVFGMCYAGRFENASQGGRGVLAYDKATSGASMGIIGKTDSSSGTGAFGLATAGTGIAIGVWGESKSVNGVGAFAYASAGSGNTVGLEARNDSGTGTAVYGHTLATGSTDVPYGVRGATDILSSGFAVFAQGDLGASGIKSFRIDHPSDPENKYLFHYADESPFPQNVYDGNVKTDGKGYAWVMLPDYFADINTDFKYQLTVLSEDFVQAVIAKKIEGNRFLVRTSSPNTEVSWQVRADRNDLYVRRKKPTDVVYKVAPEKGTYQHPELYGLGPERGTFCTPNRGAMRAAHPSDIPTHSR